MIHGIKNLLSINLWIRLYLKEGKLIRWSKDWFKIANKIVIQVGRLMDSLMGFLN